MTPDSPRERAAAARRSQAWRARAELAAELTKARTGIPVEPLMVLGGLWAPLEAVEAWLGIPLPGTPPPRHHQHEPWQIRQGVRGPYCAACGELVG